MSQRCPIHFEKKIITIQPANPNRTSKMGIFCHQKWGCLFGNRNPSMHVSMMPAIITVRSRFSITVSRNRSKAGTGVDGMGQIDLNPEHANDSSLSIGGTKVYYFANDVVQSIRIQNGRTATPETISASAPNQKQPVAKKHSNSKNLCNSRTVKQTAPSKSKIRMPVNRGIESQYL